MNSAGCQLPESEAWIVSGRMLLKRWSLWRQVQRDSASTRFLSIPDGRAPSIQAKPDDLLFPFVALITACPCL